MYRFLLFLVTILIRPFIGISVYNKRNMQKGNGLIVSNHLRSWDVFLIALIYRKETLHFVGKQELIKNKFVAWLFKKAGFVSLAREENDVKSMIQIIRLLRQGKKVVIFPEGTRNRVNEDLQPIKNGAAVMAVSGKAPVMPMILHNRFHFFRRMYAGIGETYEYAEYYEKKMTPELIEEVGAKMFQAMSATQQELREVMALPKKERRKKFKETK